MKPSEFKQILKPLIKQTIKEVLFDEGVLSGIIKEVATGLQGANLVTEATQAAKTKTSTREDPQLRRKYEKDRQELENLWTLVTHYTIQDTPDDIARSFREEKKIDKINYYMKKQKIAG